MNFHEHRFDDYIHNQTVLTKFSIHEILIDIMMNIVEESQINVDSAQS